MSIVIMRNLFLVGVGLYILVRAIDMYLKYQLPKWAAKDFLVFAVKLGTMRATLQGEDVTGIYSNLEKGYVNASGKLVNDGKEEKSFFRERYGVEIKMFQKMKQFRIVLKEGSDNEVLETKEVIADSLFEKSSYLGEVFKAETKKDKSPIYWRYRITVKVTTPRKTMSLYEPHMMLDSAVVSAIGDFTRMKEVDELFAITVEGAPEAKLEANKRVKSEVLTYIVDSLNSNEVGNESMSEKLGFEITDFNLIQLEISDPAVAKAVQERLCMSKEMDAKEEKAKREIKIAELGAEKELKTAKSLADAKKIGLAMENEMLEKEVSIFSKAFGASASLAYLAKKNSGLKAVSLGGSGAGVNLQIGDDAPSAPEVKTKKSNDKETK